MIHRLISWYYGKLMGRRFCPMTHTLKFASDDTEPRKDSIPVAAASIKTKIRIGSVMYDINVSGIPYLSSFVRLKSTAEPQISEFTRNSIPLFDIALKDLESGYQACCRLLPADLSQLHTSLGGKISGSLGTICILTPVDNTPASVC